MRYGVYKCEETKCTTYWAFSSDVFEEAERRGFVKVKETETEMEAIQEARRLNARIAENTCDIDGLGINDDYFCASGGKR